MSRPETSAAKRRQAELRNFGVSGFGHFGCRIGNLRREAAVRTFRMSRREPPSLAAGREMVPISSLKEEGDLQSGYLVLDMAEIGTKLDSQSSPTAPPVNAKYFSRTNRHSKNVVFSFNS
ncbi:hypothetical protein C8J57DRAFT_1218461 [Mycena rebaudengoi]|nr:hypothetical protein C8J57DRAFT_1218461 [Mycena rebaudengoi]